MVPCEEGGWYLVRREGGRRVPCEEGGRRMVPCEEGGWYLVRRREEITL